MSTLSNSAFTTDAGLTKFVAPAVNEVFTDKGTFCKFKTGAGVEMSMPLHGDEFEREVVKFARDGHADPFGAAAKSKPEAYNRHVKASGSGHHS